MKKKAESVKVGDYVTIAGAKLKVTNVEISDIGKQGVKKCRIEAKSAKDEKITIVRPSDYPLEVE